MNIPSEHNEQVAFINWFRETFPGIRIIAIPNGGKRGKLEAVRMKREGLTPGVPDMFIPAWKVWVEMKRTDGGTLSEEQEDWLKYLTQIGHTAIVAYGARDAIDRVEKLCK